MYCILFLSEREQSMIIIVLIFDQARENGNNTDRYLQFHLTPKMWFLITIVAATHNLNDDLVHQYWEDQSS